MIGMPSILQALAPLWIVAGSSVLVLLADALLMRIGDVDKDRGLSGLKGSLLSALTGFVLLVALAIAALNFEYEPRLIATPASMLVVDSQASFAMTLLCAGALLTLWVSLGALSEVKLHFGEFYPLLLFSLAGALAVVCAANLIMLFFAMELMSLPFYVLAGFDRDRKQSNQAGRDAFVSGGFSSAFSLYGIALIYGATGHFDYPGIREAIDSGGGLLFAGAALLLVGMLTRISVFPFHQWSLGVASGAPTATLIFIPFAVFGASAFALTRMFDTLNVAELGNLRLTFTVLAAVSMLAGAVMALRENNVKRLLAYAAVAHAGFLLVALCVSGSEGRFAAILEVSTFVVMQAGVLAVVAAISTIHNRWESIGDYNGLAAKRPIIAGAMMVLLLALAGVPGTSGFVSRMSLLTVAIGDGQIVLTIIMGLSSIVLFAAYLRIATAMYIRTAHGGTATSPPFMAVVAIGVCVVVTLYLGIFPGEGPLAFDFLELVRRAANGS